MQLPLQEEQLHIVCRQSQTSALGSISCGRLRKADMGEISVDEGLESEHCWESVVDDHASNLLRIMQITARSNSRILAGDLA